MDKIFVISERTQQIRSTAHFGGIRLPSNDFFHVNTSCPFPPLFLVLSLLSLSNKASVPSQPYRRTHSRFAHSPLTDATSAATPKVNTCTRASLCHWSSNMSTEEQKRLASRRARIYLPEDVERHNTARDVWVIRQGKVYDVS